MRVALGDDARRRTGRLIYLIGSVVVLIVSAWALTRRVQEPVWPAAADALRGGLGPTEIVVLLPASAALEARHFDGLPVVAGLPPHPEDFDGLWLVLGPGHDLGSVTALAARYRVDGIFPLSGGTIRHLARPLHVVFDLVDRVRDAKVERRRGEAVEQPRRWRGTRRGDPGDRWREVGPHDAVFGGERARGVWLHPVAGWTTTLRYPSLPEGERLVLRLGLDDCAGRHRAGLGPVHVSIKDGDENVLVLSLRPEDGLTTQVLPAPSGPLSLTVTADDSRFAHLHVLGEVLR